MKNSHLAALALLALPALASADLAYRVGVDLGPQEFEREQRGMNLSRGGVILDAQDSTLQADLLPRLYAEAAWTALPALDLFAAYSHAQADDVDATVDRATFSNGTSVTGLAMDVPTLTVRGVTLGGRWTHRLGAEWLAEAEATASSLRLSCDSSLCGKQGAFTETAHRFETFGATLGIGYRINEQLDALLKARWETSDEYTITGYGLGLRYGF
ncbi:MAG: hypothetical protein K0S46_2475 [Moraxellaceae bacterium]|jgi:hypothetical protein|nr:hypothetical protein [Moraxellaceae bacterium]